MKPPPDDQEALQAWQPVMEAMMAAGMEEHDERQLMRNVLQVADGEQWVDAAGSEPVAATGWSWSGRFGDLDNDGWLDLYVVNGMIEETLFAHLPDHELVERNRAFRNDTHGAMMSATEWGLADSASGRGMVMADLDLDGDLDIAVNNLRSQAVLFENRLCGGHSLQLDMRTRLTGNSHAVGSLATVHGPSHTWTRTVHVADSYLSGDAPRLHFGLGDVEGEELQLTIRWIDGKVTHIDGIPPNSLVTITRD